MSRSVSASRITRRLGRFIAGFRNPLAVVQRTPFRWFTSKKPEPSLSPSLKSARGWMPNSFAPSCTASRMSQRSRCVVTFQPPPAAVHRARAGVVVLRLEEVGQHVVPAPAEVAELAPVVVVRRLAPHVDHAVDRRAPAQHLAARVDEAAPVEAGLRRRLHHPVGAGVADAVEIAHRDVHPVVVVAAARLPAAARGCGGPRSGDSRARSRRCRRPRRCSRSARRAARGPVCASSP